MDTRKLESYPQRVRMLEYMLEYFGKNTKLEKFSLTYALPTRKHHECLRLMVKYLCKDNIFRDVIYSGENSKNEKEMLLGQMINFGLNLKVFKAVLAEFSTPKLPKPSKMISTMNNNDPIKVLLLTYFQ